MIPLLYRPNRSKTNKTIRKFVRDHLNRPKVPIVPIVLIVPIDPINPIAPNLIPH